MKEIFFSIFFEFPFMAKALFTCVTFSCACPILGVILLLRKMSLMGEALSHGILPGIVVAFFIWGVWLPGFSLGGIVIGILIASFSVLISEKTTLPQDASFSGIYLISLALGVIMVSKTGGAMNVMHLLFGTVLGVDDHLLLINFVVTVMTLIVLKIIFRPLIYQCFDPLFMQSVGLGGNRFIAIFVCLVVVNLVQACQAFGTLMALGLMMIPAITARLLSNNLRTIMGLSVFISLLSSYLGLILSYYASLATGPAIVVVAGVVYIIVLMAKIVKPLTLSSKNLA
jgi:zinc/manganese transport system permease protein